MDWRKVRSTNPGRNGEVAPTVYTEVAVSRGWTVFDCYW